MAKITLTLTDEESLNLYYDQEWGDLSLWNGGKVLFDPDRAYTNIYVRSGDDRDTFWETTIDPNKEMTGFVLTQVEYYRDIKEWKVVDNVDLSKPDKLTLSRFPDEIYTYNMAEDDIYILYRKNFSRDAGTLFAYYENSYISDYNYRGKIPVFGHDIHDDTIGIYRNRMFKDYSKCLEYRKILLNKELSRIQNLISNGPQVVRRPHE